MLVRLRKSLSANAVTSSPAGPPGFKTSSTQTARGVVGGWSTSSRWTPRTTSRSCSGTPAAATSRNARNTRKSWPSDGLVADGNLSTLGGTVQGPSATQPTAGLSPKPAASLDQGEE